MTRIHCSLGFKTFLDHQKNVLRGKAGKVGGGEGGRRTDDKNHFYALDEVKNLCSPFPFLEPP